jgi:predicted dehydrogenase
VGSFSQRVVIKGLQACGEAQVVALFGRTRERLAAVAAEHSVPAYYDDYAAFLAHPGLDAVVICTPNDTHYRFAVQALDAGKHVICEKPLAMSVQQAEALYRLARARGLRTAVNFTYRSVSPLRTIARVLEEGTIGRLYFFTIEQLQNLRADPTAPFTWRMDRAQAGGGALWDLGVHLIDLVHWWIGPIEAVVAQTAISVPQRPDPRTGTMVEVTTDDTAMVLVRADEGVQGVLQTSQIAQGRQNHLRIALYGSRGGLLYDADRDKEPELRISHLPAGAEGRSGPFVELPIPRELLVSYEEFPAFHMARLVRQLKGTEEFPSFADGMRCQAVLDAAERSVRSGTWEIVRVPPL